MLTGYMDFFQIIQNKLLIVNMCCRKRSKSNDRIHRRADIMRHIIQKHSLRPVRMFCSRKCISQIPILRNLTFFFFCRITDCNQNCTQFGITVIGTIVGIICGWNGKKLDTILMRISDIFLAFPGLVFALAVAAVMGGGVQNAVIALGAISWPKYARIARSQTLAQKESLYMRAAILSGCSTGKLILKHILPNITGPILVTAMLDIGTMMMELAGLSFLGLGAKPPVAEWGSMMSDTRNLLTTHPWVTFAPGIAIFLSVMVFNLLGDTVRDLLDPRNER